MSRTWVLTALGKDRPGIVAGVTKILYEAGCNLEDSAMTRLGGEFTIMLLFAAPASLTQRRLEDLLRPLAKRLGLAIHAKALPKAELTAHPRGKPYVLSVYGADRPGIVYRVSDLLARVGANITDVSTHRAAPAPGKRTKPLYALLLEVELPARIRLGDFERWLHRLAKRLGVEVSVHSAETPVL